MQTAGADDWIVPGAAAVDDFRVPTQTAQKSADEGGSSLGAFFRGMLHGAGNTLYGAAQFAGRMGPPAMLPGAAAGQQRLQQDIDQRIQQREQAFQAAPQTQAHGTASGLGTLAGEVGSTALIPGGGFVRGAGLAAGAGRALPSAAGMIARGVGLGAAGAATQPVTEPDYWAEKEKQMAIGGAAGGALPAAGGMIAPRLPLNPAMQQLQNIQKAFRPLYNFVTGAEDRTVDGFDRTIARQVLDPIGGDVPRNLKGHELVKHVEEKIGDRYDEILPNITLPRSALGPVDPEFKRFVGTMSTDHQSRFKNLVQNYVADRFGSSGSMDGDTYKRMTSELSRRGYGWLKSSNDKELGQATFKLLEHVRDGAAVANPLWAKKLSDTDHAWSLFARMADAADKPKAEGKFKPADLLSVLAAHESKPRSFAKGDEALQKYAQVGYRALGEGRSNLMQLLHPFTRHGAIMEAGRSIAQPIGRAGKAASPFVAAPAGREAAKAAELREQSHDANRRGDLSEMERLARQRARLSQ